MTPGMVARRGPEAIAGAVSLPAVKFDFWRSMADLGALVMRSGAPGLGWRVGASLALVFVGKLAGVAAPVALGDPLHDPHVEPGEPADRVAALVAVALQAHAQRVLPGLELGVLGLDHLVPAGLLAGDGIPLLQLLLLLDLELKIYYKNSK